ncbi:MAG: glutamyl-tRNA reductase [Thermoprotei archaeon]
MGQCRFVCDAKITLKYTLSHFHSMQTLEASYNSATEKTGSDQRLIACLVTHNQVNISKLQNYSILSRMPLSQAGSEFRAAGCRGIVILETCNRIEVYADLEPEARPESVLSTWIRLAGLNSADNLVLLSGEDLARHLFRVSAGLDSAVVGEAEILSQVKTAYFRSAELDLLSPDLDFIFHAAIVVGKRVREKTHMSGGHVSVASTAVSLVKSLTSGRTALVVGAGSLGSKVIRILRSEGFKVFVANRTYEKALTLSSQTGAEAVLMAETTNLLSQVDAVFSATASKIPPIGAEVLNTVRRPLIFVDLSTHGPVSKDSVVNPLVSVRSIEDIKSMSREAFEARKSETGSVERMVEEALGKLLSKKESEWVEDLIRMLYVNAEAVRKEELSRALRRIESGHVQIQEIMDNMTKSIVKKLLEEQTTVLRSASKYGRDTPLEKFFEMLKVELLE